jgi:hypothetical protein
MNYKESSGIIKISYKKKQWKIHQQREENKTGAEALPGTCIIDAVNCFLRRVPLSLKHGWYLTPRKTVYASHATGASLPFSLCLEERLQYTAGSTQT